MERVEYVKGQLLKNHTIKVRSDWIEDCVNFFVSQAESIDDHALYQQAFEQFLLANLKDASNHVIPVTVLEKKQSFTLHGTFVLQMNFLIDIAESPYEQWRRLHNIKLDEVDEIKESRTFKAKKKRVFKLELTDGYKTIYAMEYATIPSLNTKIPPGSKVQIIGPLQVINHILMLEPKNIKILGGDVDDLLIVNAYENVLLRALNKPITDLPVKDYQEEVPVESSQRAFVTVESKPMQSSINRLPEEEENFLAGIDFDDECDVDMEMLSRIEEEDKIARSQHRSERIQSPIVLQDEDDTFLASIDFDNIAVNQMECEPVEIIEIPDVRQRPVVRSNIHLIPPIEIPDDDNFEEKHLSELSLRSAQNSKELIPKKIARIEPTRIFSPADDHYKFKTDKGDNIVTIDQYLSLTTAEKMRKNYVIWGSLNPIISTLKINDNGWQLNCDLSDPYSNQRIFVKLHNNILENLSGVTGPEMKLKYKEAKQQPQLKEDILKIFDNLKNKLDEIECFMRVELELQSTPQIVALLEGSRINNQAFAKKVQEEDLKEVE